MKKNTRPAVILFLMMWASVSTLTAMGLGGGGAMGGISFSPLSLKTFYIATDMGLIYRTEDGGQQWLALSNEEIKPHYNIQKLSRLFFSD